MSAQDREGQTLGHYRLMKLLGKGGYAEVYLAENVHLGVQAAIKMLKLRDLDYLEQEQFRSEAKVMTNLIHPRIVRVLDYDIEMSQRGSGNDGSTPYLVMEYAPLGSLRHLYPRGQQMPLSKVVSYTRQIAEALQYAHDKDITHLDVKPENMLVRKPDDVALSDFGIAISGLNTGNVSLQLEQIQKKKDLGEQVLVRGTAAYLAPERLQGVTQRSCDQYSLAIVVYEWLSGSRPFEGTDLEICKKQLHELPPPLSRVFPPVPREVGQVIMKALAKEPGDRYNSVREFALALERAAQASAQPTPPISTPLPPTLPPTPLPPTVPRPTPQTPPSPTPLPPTVSPPPIQPQVFLGTPGPVQTPQTSTGDQNPGISWLQPPPFIPEASVTVENPMTGPGNVVAQPAEDVQSGLIDEISSVFQASFETDRFFGQSQRTRQIRLLGIPLNILSALIVLLVNPFPLNLIVAIIGAAAAVAMLWRCTVSVKNLIAIAFGAGVAFWWGYVAGSVAARFDSPAAILLAFLLAFSVSLGIHVWYVYNRLKS